MIILNKVFSWKPKKSIISKFFEDMMNILDIQPELKNDLQESILMNTFLLDIPSLEQVDLDHFSQITQQVISYNEKIKGSDFKDSYHFPLYLSSLYELQQMLRDLRNDFNIGKFSIELPKNDCQDLFNSKSSYIQFYKDYLRFEKQDTLLRNYIKYLKYAYTTKFDLAVFTEVQRRQLLEVIQVILDFYYDIIENYEHLEKEEEKSPNIMQKIDMEWALSSYVDDVERLSNLL